MNCLTYVRVSTDKQAEKELSIPAQLQAMRQYASDRGWKVLQEFVEAGESARTADRPALRQLLQRCRSQELPKVEVVLVHKLDRFARNLADHVALRAQLRERGITLASVTESLEDSVSGQLVEHILASMAEFYSANLSEEVKKGMRQKILQGGWPHRPPRGYRIVYHGERSVVVIDDVQGPLIRKAFDFCLRDYRGLVDLRRRLAAAGFRTLRGGKPVSNAYVVNLLTNPFYCGQMRWKGDVYPATHPPLVSVVTFAQVQRILKNRSRPLIRKPTKFLLTGLAHCAQCGLLVGGEEHRRWKYYRCRGSFKSFDRCRSRYCNLDCVHRTLESTLQSIAMSASTRTALVRLLAQSEVEQEQDRERARAAARAALAVLQQREWHLTKAFTDGLLTSEGYQQALASLAAERENVKKAAPSTDEPGVARVERLRSAITRVHTAWDVYVLLDQPQQRLLIELLFERLEIGPAGVVRHSLRESRPRSAAA